MKNHWNSKTEKGAIHLKEFTATNIRNVALAGHSRAGKTTLAEALLFKAGATDRLGKVQDGNTCLLYTSRCV